MSRTYSFLPVFNNASQFLDIVIVSYVVGIRPENDKVFKHGSLREELISSELSPLVLANQYRGIVRLETRNLLGFACLADSIYCHTNAHLRLYGFHFFVYCQEHAGVDAQGQVVKEVVVFAADECFHVGSGVKNSK